MVNMILELVLPFEGGVAVLAIKGTGIRMYDQMFCQSLLNAKGLVADLTFVWLLT